MIDDPDLHRLFQAESDEHLARLDDGLLRLEQTPADLALLEEVFRESHSLKGAARMLGLSRIEASAHRLESCLNAARKGEAPLTPALIEHMTAALADLRRHVEAALAGAPEPASPEVSSARLLPADQGIATTAPASASPKPSSAIPAAASDADHGTPLAPPAGHLPALGAGARDLQSLPTAAPASAAPSTPGVALDPIDEAAAVSAPFRIETVRVETRKLDDLLTQAGELSVIRERVGHRQALMEALLEGWEGLEHGRRGARVAGSGGGNKDAHARFGALLKQVRDALLDDSARLESVATLVQAQARELRLLPLAKLFALFPRMVRDLAREQGKELELALEGGDITVDKRILEGMKAPLMHLLRNAIDHGIEPPAERARLGKPRVGTLRLAAARGHDGVVLTVSDDGRGLDLAAIRRAADRRGLHDPATLAAMTASALQPLVLLPGFSTSTYVTELSGRGVGLDVVRVNVEQLKGDIVLHSTVGQGLTVQLRLPLSLTTARLLLASAGNQVFGLPIECVQTSRRVQGQEIFSLEGRPAILLDGQPLIVASLAELLALPTPGPHRSARGNPTAPEPLACVVIQVGEERLGLLTDGLRGEEEVVPKPLGAPLKRVRNVSALAMLASGAGCAILNPADLLKTAHTGARGLAQVGPATDNPAAAAVARTAVLLVEDSALVRAMERRILVDAGYEVVTAVDGVDALDTLASRAFDAVVSDIRMPHMDGLTLTAHIRAESRYKDLPVILVTTLASEDDQRRGLEVGANAYLPKPSFDQRLLIETLARLVGTGHRA